MKILQSIQLGNSGPGCGQCVHFNNDPALIEELWRGLTSLSSGYASVRAGDGFCNYHHCYLSDRESCPQLQLRPQPEECKWS
ncbi:MAG TPA: hypothetical protein VI233_01215 [Puia sp.]